MTRANLSCNRCGKKLSRKTARLIGGEIMCSACLFPPLKRDSGRLPQGEDCEAG